MFLSNLSISRPVFASVLMLSLITLGIFSYRQLSIDMYPDVEIPVISIVTKYPGASPESVEREVSKRIEEAVNPIAGVKHVISFSKESVSTVVVEFRLEIKVNEASQEARSKINSIRGELPSEIEEPIIQKLDFSAMPIISLAVRSTALGPRELSTLVEKKIKRRIESISGVGKVDLVGLSKREVNVEIDPLKLESLGMGVDQVINGLQSENVNTPLGRLKRNGSEYPLRISGKPDAVEQFNNMVIGQSNSRPIKLSEVAKVKDGIEEKRSLALVNGTPAVGIDVLKQSGANTVGVVDSVKKIIDKIQRDLPSGTTIDMVRDGSIMIRDSVHDVKKSMVEGGILTIIIVFMFLNSWRSTVITGLTLPISVIASFIIMNSMQMTLNVMTLMALSLSIGLLIDDAIVVRENIVRHMEGGNDHFKAARDGTAEIGLAVMATTFCIVAVFIPVAYMKGIVGRFFFQFGITVTFAVLISLFVSFTLDPMLSSRWYDPDIERRGKRHLIARILDLFNESFDRWADRYKTVIAWSLGHRFTIILFAVLAFIGGVKLFSALPSTFMQDYDRSELIVSFKTSPDASIDESSLRLDSVLKALSEYQEVETTYATIGAGDSGTVRDVSVYIKLVEKSKRQRSQEEIQQDLRGRLTQIPGILPAILAADNLNGDKALVITIQGEEIGELKRYAASMKEKLYKIKGIVDLEVSMEHDIPEVQLTVNRERAIDAGVMTSNIVSTVSAMVGGQAVSTYEDEDGDAVDVRIRLPYQLRQYPAQVEKLRLAVADSQGKSSLIPLGELISYTMSSTPSEINRRDLTRQVTISANLDGLDMGTAMKEIKIISDNLKMAPGYQVVLSGEAEDMVEAFTYMAEALLLAVVFVYLILAAQFESFIDPLSIMFSLPLSVVGMAAMLYLTKDSISIMSLIGLIMLMGLVTKNAILLIDYTKILRAEGMERRAALINAGRTRLRPILMTTLAMIFGMVPLALGLGAGAEMRAPMARAVIGGLITSTLLTLLVVPVMYTILDDISGWFSRRWKGRKKESGSSKQNKSVVTTLILSLFALTIFCSGGTFSTPDSAFGQERVKTAFGYDVTNLDLDGALTLAAEKNKDIKVAQEYRRKVEGIYIEERSAALPKIGFNGTVQYGKDESQRAYSDTTALSNHSYGGEITLKQPLYTWGQIGAAVRAAKIGIMTSDDQLKLHCQAVARDVSTAFYDLLLSTELQQIARRNLELKLHHLDESRRKYSAGVATDYDVLSAEVAVKNARPEVIQYENLERVLKERLGMLIGIQGDHFNITGVLNVTAKPLQNIQQTVQRAWNNRAELSELNHQLGMREELIKVVNAADKPRVDLQASYGWNDLTVEDSNESGNTVSTALIFSYPFFDGMNTRGRLEQARSEVRSLMLQKEKLKDSIRLEVFESFSTLRESVEIVNALTGTVAQAEELASMAEDGFIYGVKTHLDVQDSQLSVKQARGNLAKAKRDYLVAEVTLKWVIGELHLPALSE